MKTNKEIEETIDKAEQEIKAILIKHELTIGMLYEEGVSIMLSHQQSHPSGDHSFFEREAFTD